MSTLTIRLENKPGAKENLEIVKQIFGEKNATSAIFEALRYASNKKSHEKKYSELKYENESLRNYIEKLQGLIKEKNEIEKKIKDLVGFELEKSQNR